MSIVVDSEQFENLENDPFEESEEVVSDEVTTDELEDEVAEPDLPEKFKGKSIEEIVQAYQEAENALGRKNNEVGELRKLTDQMLELQLKGNTPQEEVKKEVDFDSLIDNPSDVVNHLVDENPRIKALEEKLLLSERQAQQAAFEKKHPDYLKKVQSEDFLSFVQESPIRQQMFVEANNSYNYQMADELFTLYDAIKGQQVQAKQEESKGKRDKALKDASVEKGTTGASSKKIYRRTDLLKLRMTDPDRYAAMEPEIILAYQEKRVR